MKKRLESELISIAHRILKLKNKSEIDQLQLETKKLYETLTVLKFYGDNFEQFKDEITQDEIEEKLNSNFEEKSIEEKSEEIIEAKIKNTPKITSTKLEEEVVEPEVEAEIEKVEIEKVEKIENHEHEVNAEQLEEIAEDENIEESYSDEQVVAEDLQEVEEVVVDKIDDDKIDYSLDAIFEMASEEIKDENPINKNDKKEPKEFSFDELLGQNYTEPVFVKTVDSKSELQFDSNPTIASKVIEKKEEKNLILNDRLTKGINVGLNDRVAFVKHLFGDSSEDFNRVLSQLNTMDTLQEAHDFINQMVKPDYNDWKDKDEYAERFIEIIEKKFI
jgi:hypothetical protein